MSKVNKHEKMTLAERDTVVAARIGELITSEQKVEKLAIIRDTYAPGTIAVSQESFIRAQAANLVAEAEQITREAAAGIQDGDAYSPVAEAERITREAASNRQDYEPAV